MPHTFYYIIYILLLFQNSSAPKGKPINSDNYLQSIYGLIKYISSLQDIIRYASANENEVKPKFAAGLYLVNVNLKAIEKYSRLPNVLKMLLNHNSAVLDKFRNNETSKKFHYKKNSPEYFLLTDMVNSLFFDEITWIQGITPFGKTQAKIYGSWFPHKAKVDGNNHTNQKTAMNQNCLFTLADHKINYQEEFPRCYLPEKCRRFIFFGSDSKKEIITNRLLHLIIAKLARRCVIFSKKQDDRLRDELCGLILKESEHSFRNDNDFVDYLAEQIALCSLDGHSEFINRSWLDAFLLFQAPSGCIASSRNFTSDIDFLNEDDEELNIYDSYCVTSSSGVMAAALASTIRYTFELFL